VWAAVCGVARAHARTGDPVAVGSYLGKGEEFDDAVTEFAFAYADQNEHDHAAFVKAVAIPTPAAASS
jgi:predicted alpha/beta hydrolase